VSEHVPTCRGYDCGGCYEIADDGSPKMNFRLEHMSDLCITNECPASREFPHRDDCADIRRRDALKFDRDGHVYVDSSVIQLAGEQAEAFRAFSAAARELEQHSRRTKELQDRYRETLATLSALVSK